MGKGNICKANAARAKNAAKEAAAGKVSTSETRKKAEEAKATYQCAICMQGFMHGAQVAELQTHLDNKHGKSGKTFADAFPSYVAKNGVPDADS